jgi:hypothetical protein
MKLAFICAAAIAAAAFATPVLAQGVVEDPSYCAQSYPNANHRNLGAGNPYTDCSLISHQLADNNAYRYHGGPKYND